MKTEKFLIQKCGNAQDLPLPVRATPLSAGLDLCANVDLVLLPGARALVPTGIKTAVPEGCEIQLRPRSGLALEHGVTVLNAPATIDADYRGELKVLLINHGSEPFCIQRGDRIAQMVTAPVIMTDFEEAEQLPQTVRGEGGFGHSGRSVLCALLAFVLIFASVPVHASEPADFDRMLAELRREFFAPIAPSYDTGLRQIFRERNYPHMPPIDASHELIPADENNLLPLFTPQNYVPGSRRQFNVVNQPFGRWGTLVRQSTHVNIWTLDDTAPFGAAQLDSAITDFDDITYRITRDFAPFRGTRIEPNFLNMPLVGDVHGDGRVNVLLHDSTNAAGYFWSRNFMTEGGNVPLALFTVRASASDAICRGTFAHELQHLLFFIHFGVYNSGPQAQAFLWFNEALSELAEKYWTEEGARIISPSRIIGAAENSYANWDNRTGDFISFNNSFKNYDMSMLYASLMHRKTPGNFVGAIYDFFIENFPPARTNAEFNQNRNRIEAGGMKSLLGDALSAAGLTGTTGASGATGASGETAFALLYFLFMENFAADGGNIVTANAVISTEKFVTNNPFAAHNLWGVRPTLGTSNILPVDGRYHFTLSNRAPVPLLLPGGVVTITAFNNPPPSHNATLDRLYRLAGEQVGGIANYLAITVTDDNPMTQWYVVIPNDAPGAVSSNSNRTLGQHGADVFPLNRGGAQNLIYTGGRTAYLFIATLSRNVSATVQHRRTGPPPTPTPSPSPSPVPGDMNNDRELTAYDVLLLRQYLAGIIPMPDGADADVNRDGAVDIRDLTLLRLAGKVSHNTKTALSLQIQQ